MGPRENTFLEKTFHWMPFHFTAETGFPEGFSRRLKQQATKGSIPWAGQTYHEITPSASHLRSAYFSPKVR